MLTDPSTAIVLLAFCAIFVLVGLAKLNRAMQSLRRINSAVEEYRFCLQEAQRVGVERSFLAHNHYAGTMPRNEPIRRT